jgi:hypothetical protein
MINGLWVGARVRAGDYVSISITYFSHKIKHLLHTIKYDSFIESYLMVCLWHAIIYALIFEGIRKRWKKSNLEFHIKILACICNIGSTDLKPS